MATIKLGILGTSEIAFRRFLPALSKCKEFEYVGVASRDIDRTKSFIDAFGGRGYDSYDMLLADESVDAVYLPLPPALHYPWGKKVLERGKHLLMEKPFTTSLVDTTALLSLAVEKGLAVHENYMFLYHSQLTQIEEQLKAGVIGELRLIRAAFGFPWRGETDFRYQKAMGGGSLLDCGGYPLRLALRLLGENARVTTSRLVALAGYDVDIYGSVTVENNAGQVAQLSFGMDNSYKCELELWGSKAELRADRIFTAPPRFEPVLIRSGIDGVEQITEAADDSFQNSIMEFNDQISDPKKRAEARNNILFQSQLVEAVQRGERKQL